MGPHVLALPRRALLAELRVFQAHPWSWCRCVAAFTADVPRVLCVHVARFVLLSVHSGGEQAGKAGRGAGWSVGVPGGGPLGHACAAGPEH